MSQILEVLSQTGESVDDPTPVPQPPSPSETEDSDYTKVTPLGISKDLFINSNGVHLLQSLFFETALKRPDLAVYTLSERDKTVQGKLFPSLYRLYLKEQDLTEFIFAEKHLFSFTHWEILTEANWFLPHLQKWRRNLNLQITAKALKSVLAEAQTPSKNQFPANKILIDRLGNEELQKPSKKKPRNDPSAISDKILADLQRLGD